MTLNNVEQCFTAINLSPNWHEYKGTSMPQLTCADPHEKLIEVTFDPGETILQATYRAGVSGILAECGGGCSCATCHVILDEAWEGTLVEPSAHPTIIRWAGDVELPQRGAAVGEEVCECLSYLGSEDALTSLSRKESENRGLLGCGVRTRAQK